MVDRTAAVLVVGCTLAIAWAAYEWQRPVQLPEEAISRPNVERPPLALPSATAADRSGYPAITQRPLFQPTRRPADLTIEAAPVAPTEPVAIDHSGELKAYRLTAIVRDADRLLALIERAGMETWTVSAGDHVGNWTASQIYDDRIVLTNGSQQEELVLRQFDPPSPGAIQPRGPLTRMRRADAKRPPNSPVEPAVVRAEEAFPAPATQDPKR